MYTLHYSKSKKFDLPGRVVYSMVGNHGIKSDRMSFGIAELPPKTKMEPPSRTFHQQRPRQPPALASDADSMATLNH